jgi:hypothetical protein
MWRAGYQSHALECLEEGEEKGVIRGEEGGVELDEEELDKAGNGSYFKLSRE